MRRVIFEPGMFYHVFNRGNEKREIFFEAENYRFFLRRLDRAVQERGSRVIAYCLMPNHFHLLMQETTRGGIGKVMHSVETSYAKAINRRYDRVGHLFQGPFDARHVDRRESLMHVCRYLDLNPVFAKLVSTPEEWEFSSYCDYIGLRNGRLARKEVVLAEFDGVDDYRDFVMSHQDLSLIREYIVE